MYSYKISVTFEVRTEDYGEYRCVVRSITDDIIDIIDVRNVTVTGEFDLFDLIRLICMILIHLCLIDQI